MLDLQSRWNRQFDNQASEHRQEMERRLSDLNALSARWNQQQD